MGNIVDLSGFQKSNNIDWANFSKNVDLIIARVQYGSTRPDSEYNNHISNAKKYNLKFNTYTFPAFVSVDDARVEARDCYTRHDKDSGFIWLDIESEYDGNRNPIGITKLPQNVRLEGLKAYVDELRKQGAKKVGAYIAHNCYEPWAINTIIGIFDAIWIPRYGAKPKYPCDLHQYTSTGRVAGYSGDLDLSVINGDKGLDYFTGNTQTSHTQPSTTNKPIMRVRALVRNDIRTAPSHNAGFVRDAIPPEEFDVYEIRNIDGTQWHLIGGDPEHGEFWIDGNNGQNLFWIDNPNLKQAPTPSIHIVQNGETLGKIAANNGTTVSKLASINGIKDVNKIYVGQKIKLN